MNTKRIIYASAITLVTLILIGCDSLLDVKPQTDMTDANFWNTEQDLRAAANRLYTQLPNTQTPGMWHDARADDRFGRTPNGISTGQRVTPVTGGEDWTDPYRRIFQANNIIEKAPRASVSERIINRYVAEARFFRAWEYFHLAAKYGDVPLVLKTFTSTQDPDLKMGRTPREEVIQQCYEDLRFAAQWLPSRTELMQSPDNANEFHRRRVTQSSALGLMVRIGLHEGTMRKYHNIGSDWQAHLDVSIATFERLRDEPGHGHDLYRGDGTRAFLGAFLEERNAQNPEIMFGKAIGLNGAAAGTTAAGNILTDYSVNAADNFGFTRTMVDLFLYADGLPGNKSAYYLPAANETSFNSVFGYETDGVTPNGHPRDPRLTQTFWRINDPDDRTDVFVAGMGIGWQHRRGENYNFFIVTTREAPGYKQKKMFWGAETNRDWADKTYIRWGEMLIAYAEALYERNGSITDAQLDATVNALRTRVGFNVRLTNAFVATNGLNMQEEIRRERTVELMGENQRYNDIIRWKIAENVLPNAIIGIKYFHNEAGVPMGDAQRAERLTKTDGTLDGVFAYPSGDMYVWEKANSRKFNPLRDYFYPIPTNEIAKSDNNIKQNPNWD
jgi:hypothetical protein